MPVVPSTHDFATGSATSTEMNAFVRDPLKFLQRPPVAELRQTAAQSIANATYVPVQFNAEDVDTDVDNVGGHDNAVNNSRFTARYPGWYQVSGSVGYVGSAAGTRRIAAWSVNGSIINGGQVNSGNAGAGADVEVVARTKVVFLSVGDYVELDAWQDTGGALNTASATAAPVQASMSVRWVSQ